MLSYLSLVGILDSLISAVVLAAGLSKRMGRPKLVMELRGKAVLERVLEALRSSRVDETVVVLGADSDEVQRRVTFKTELIVINPRSAEGMSSSLRLALKSVDEASEAALVVLGDQPFLSASTVDAIIESYISKHPPFVVPVYKGKRGNPVLMSRSVFPEVMGLRGDVGAKSVVDRYRDRALEVKVDDPGILFDLDTPDDYQRAVTGKD